MSDNLDPFPAGVVSHSLKTFEGCSHNRASFDLCEICSLCRVRAGRQECHRYNNCMFSAEWDDITWDLYEVNVAKKEGKHCIKQEKAAARSQLVSMEDSVSMHLDPEEEN